MLSNNIIAAENKYSSDLTTADITNSIEVLDSPSYKDQFPKDKDIYARNVWDLQNYKVQLYIGARNSSNRGPSINAGPFELIKYIPEDDRFLKVRHIKDH